MGKLKFMARPLDVRTEKTREAIIRDFNGDGKPDKMVVQHHKGGGSSIFIYEGLGLQKKMRPDRTGHYFRYAFKTKPQEIMKVAKGKLGLVTGADFDGDGDIDARAVHQKPNKTSQTYILENQRKQPKTRRTRTRRGGGRKAPRGPRDPRKRS